MGFCILFLGGLRKTLCHHIIYEIWNPSSHTGLSCMYILTITRAGKERNVQGGSLAGEVQKACWKSRSSTLCPAGKSQETKPGSGLAQEARPRAKELQSSFHCDLESSHIQAGPLFIHQPLPERGLYEPLGSHQGHSLEPALASSRLVSTPGRDGEDTAPVRPPPPARPCG